MKIQWVELLPQDGGVIQRSPKVVQLPEGTQVCQALRALGWTDEQVNAALSERSVSIYGQYALTDTVLHDGDRIEILDSLRFNPMDSRRRRAAHKAGTEQKRGRRSGQSNT